MKKQTLKQKACNKTDANVVGADLVSARKEITNSKTIANSVGIAPLGDPHFEEHAKNTPRANLNPNSNISLLTSNHRGITLIALIITIIVMLILVGVTINVALNGGLFGKAREGASGTQIELDKEILASAALGTMGENGEVNFEELDANLPDGFEGSNGTYEKDGITFIVDKYGGVTTKEKSTGDLALLEKYFFGENGEKKNLQTLLNVDNEDGMFKDDPKSIPDASTSLKAESELSDKLGLCYGRDDNNFEDFLVIKYNKKLYRLDYYLDQSSEAVYAENIEIIYEPKGREGEKVQYDGDNNGEKEEWIILYDNGENVEIIPMNLMGDELTLGKYDETVRDLKEDIDKNGTVDDIDKVIYSYNNAITRLNDFCNTIITNPNKISVRSIGSNPNNPSSENNTLYTSDKFEELDNGRYNGLIKGTDMNFEQDFIRFKYYDISLENFWVASRLIDYFDNFARNATVIILSLDFGNLTIILMEGYLKLIRPVQMTNCMFGFPIIRNQIMSYQ